MKANKSLKLVSTLLLVAILMNMILTPGAVQAGQQATISPAVASVVNGGERFMDAAPQAMGNALQLAQLLDYIAQTDEDDLTEATLVQARQHALETARQAATAQGALGAMANGLDELGYQAQAAAGVDALVADLEANGFDPELETALADAGLTSTQIANLETATAADFTLRRTGLSTDTITLLQDAGLTGAEIDQVEQTLAEYGLADTTLPDRLAQLRASQEEMSLVRTQALVVYIQLLTQQVFMRQRAGDPGRDMTPADVDALVRDQLRLLIHIGYLDSLWGGNPDPDVAEGQWLFIERYSLRVAERLDALILETHNLGLVVDLLVALQIHSTALAALAGDAPYAKADLDPLADFLARMLGDNSLPGGQAARRASPPAWWAAPLALGERNPVLIAGYQPPLEPEAVAAARDQAQGRIAGLAAPLGFPAAQGSVNETDETNNVDQIVFHTTPPSLPPGVLDMLNQVLGGSTPLEFLWEILTGQTENWWAIGGNMFLSFLPIGGEALDLLALFTDPSVWGKAMAFIGLLASVLSDGAEVLTAIGAVVPPTLAATVPGSALLEALDVGAAILKNVKKFVTTDVYNLIKRIPFDEALKLGSDVLGHLARRAVDVVGGAGHWPGSLGEVFNLIQSVLSSVWDPFVALLTHYGVDGLGDFFRVGFSDGGLLAGRVLSHGDELKNVDGLIRIGDDLGQAAADFSDDAARGLAKVVEDVDEEGARRFLDFSGCLISGLAYDGRVGGLASPLLQGANCDVAEQVAEVVHRYGNFEFNEAALEGMNRTVTHNGREFVENAISRLSQTYSNQVINDTFDILSRQTSDWSPKAVDGLAKTVNRVGRDIADGIVDRTGGTTAGKFACEWLDDVAGASSPHFDTWAKDLTRKDANFTGAVFELRYGSEKLTGEGILTFQDWPDGRQGMDFIMSDGRYIDLKNWSQYNRGSNEYQHMVKQFRNNLGIDEAGKKVGDGRYGDQIYEYVFRGPRDRKVIDDLCKIASQAKAVRNLSDDNFRRFTIRFLDWSAVLPDESGSLPGLGAAASVIVACES